MESLFLRGILIGIIFGIPAGAVGAMTVERTWNYGVKAGLLTGLGSSVADCIYAGIGAFGLTVISDFLLMYQHIVHLVGGSIVLGMGLGLLIGKEKKAEISIVDGKIGMFLSSFVVGITNPAAIMTFLFAFSWFGITGNYGAIQGMKLVMGVFFGTYIWWGILSGSVGLAKRKGKLRNFQYMNRVFGVILSILGISVFIRSLVK